MAAVERRGTDAATLELWRIAETGDVDALAAVLQRVADINARNEHGVTALMRAAQFGHVRMVSALLQHGADANITRNDKFTALALAAFFGHTQVVRALMEHGADSQAPTRYGTSPHMWATARTFNEVVHQLEKPAPPEKVAPPKRNDPVAPVVPTLGPRPAPAARTASAGPVVGAVIRTLKEPPEIWDLVHEVPKGFDARSAFKSRLMEAGIAFRLAAVVILIGAGVVGVLILRGVQARSDGSAEVRREAPVTDAISNVQAPAVVTTEQPIATAPDTELAPSEPTLDHVSESPVLVSKRSSQRSGRIRSRPFESEPAEQDATASKLVQPSPTIGEKSSTPERIEAPAKNKNSSSLSPQLISPAQNSAAKGKVIQWP